MKAISLVILGLTISTLGQAKPILLEDGSSFTGHFQVQESSCAKRSFNYETGKVDLIVDFVFEGTIEGIKIDGRLLEVRDADVENAKPDSGVTIRARYVSSNEFIQDGVLHFEKIGGMESFSAVYKVDDLGNITGTTTNTNGRPEDNKVCHFVRMN